MKNGRVQAVILTLEKHGIEANAELALDILSAISTRSDAEFEIGDFVLTNEGMGNVGFGEVRGLTQKGYDLMMWDEAKREFTYLRRDFIGGCQISSKKEADEYYQAMTKYRTKL